MRITKEELQKLVQESKSGREVSRKAHISHTGTRYLIDKYKLDTSHFTHGRTYLSLIDTQHGLLTVKTILRVKNERTKLLCLCSCGNKKVLRADSLHKYYSCGCASSNRPSMIGNKNPAFNGKGDLRASFISDIKRSARRRNLKYSLTINYLWDIFIKQDKKCALTGEQLTFGRVHRSSETNASLDRIDSSIGYIEDNVQWVIKEINILKRNTNNKRFIELCKLVAQNRPTET